MKKLMMLVIVTLLGLPLLTISTATACECGPVGTGTPGYWMNHPEAWPVEEIMVGTQTFSKGVAIEWMKLPVKGDKTLTMFSAFVAAKLNVAIGNCLPACYSLAEVNDWLTSFPVGTGVTGNSEAWRYSHGEALYWCLDGYNNGLQSGSPSRDTLD